MQNDSVQEQLEALRHELRVFGSSLANLRQDDFREVYSEQIQSVLLEKIDRFFFELRKEGAPSEAWGVRERCETELIGLVKEVISIYQHHDEERALHLLDDHESGITDKDHSCLDPPCANFKLDLLHQIRTYLEISDRNFRQFEPSGHGLVPTPSQMPREPLSPTLVEKTLSPLTNSWRIGLLMLLSNDNRSLAELSKEMGLKKGHLQFHLKSLLGSGYIQVDRKTHLYSITSRGSIALDGVAKLIDRLSST